jgi:hypothetical protein
MTEVDPGEGLVSTAVSEQIAGARISDLNDCVLVVDDESVISSLWCAIVEGMGSRSAERRRRPGKPSRWLKRIAHRSS